MTLTGVAVAHLIAKDGVPLVPAIALGAGGRRSAIGVINAVVVVVMRIDSFIGTLATGSLIAALITMVTNEVPITDAKLGGAFAKIGQTSIGGVTLPVVYCAVVAVAIWYLLEHTATGRRLYATGFNPDAARLAGVRTTACASCRWSCSGGLAGVTGHRPRVDARQRVADAPARRTCCPRSPRRSWARRSSSTGASTPAARSSPSCCSGPASPASRWPTPPSGPATCSSASS